MEMKFTSVEFTSRVTEGCRKSWLQTLGNQHIDHSPYIRCMYMCILTSSTDYCIILLEYINKSHGERVCSIALCDTEIFAGSGTAPNLGIINYS